MRDGQFMGVMFAGAGTKGRLEGCEITHNGLTGLAVTEGADPLISSCR